ncbi:hypothetical protein ATI61_111304 [Archangium gephyra]|uniref:Uncharacterized protein n=1 Tax=Archangium gephyra TaxID=48 RepID=A0AAC8TII8_9BACT|nr:hypothetical protein [Archangium gephyra]AKJ07352.1 Hypothetical protein AA314_08978 [Archangium gephyra]REG26753.1 hypothetical protein ATI61_111304 [Archangium gephyra]
MSERVRTAVSSGSPVGLPSAEDMRRQLEGRVEVMEASRERYAALESLLSGVRWKRRLRAQHAALEAVLRHEAAFHEAMDRIQRRAQADGWPVQSPVLVMMRDVWMLRSRLETLVHKRIDELAPVSGAPSLVEELPRLERLVFQAIPLEPIQGEVRLLEGDTADVGFALRLYVSIIGALALGPLANRWGGELLGLALLVVLFANIVHGVVCSGRYWLTSKRLVWKPYTGETVQLLLRSITEEGVQASWLGVRVLGERKLFIQDVAQGHVLAVLMELRRQPLLDSARTERLADVVCYAATLEGMALPDGASMKGYVVLRPGYVAFLPRNRGTQVLRAITGARSSPNVRAREIPHLLEQLRYLPSESEFDACVARAVAAAGGVRWSAWETRYDASVPVWKEIHLQTQEPSGLCSLRGKVDWSQQAEAVRLLTDWPKR